jgi:hypothetical protein
VTDFVLDASIALAWCFEDEVTASTRDVLARLATESAAVPTIWPLEMANALIMPSAGVALPDPTAPSLSVPWKAWSFR